MVLLCSTWQNGPLQPYFFIGGSVQLTSRISTLFALLAFAAISVMSLFWHVSPGIAAPTHQDWQEAGAWLSSRAQPHDVIRFRPVWLSEAETMLTVLPKDRIPFVDRTQRASVMLGARYSRLWVFSALEQTFGAPPPGSVEEGRFELNGGIKVRLYRLERDRIRFALANRLDNAVVSRRRTQSGDFLPCRKRGKAHDCLGKAWENVESDWHHVGGAPRYCFILHPYPDRGAVRIRWPQVPFESSVLLRSGFTLEAARNEKGADCQVVVSLNGDVVAEWKEPKNAWHFDEHLIDTSHVQGTEGSLQIEVYSPDEDFRDVCFDGAVLTTVN